MGLREQITEAARTVPIRLGPNAIANAQNGHTIRLSGNEADAMADAVMGLVETTQKNIRADTLFWAARQLRNVPVTCTALTGPVWYGAGWQDAADHLMDLAGWEPSDDEAERTYLATRVRELEAERELLQRRLDTAEGKRPGTWDTWAEHSARKQTEPADPPPKPSLTLEEARQQAAKHARALEGGQ